MKAENHYMVVDVSNLLNRTWHAHQGDGSEAAMGLAHHVALMSLRKYFNKFEPTKVVLTFDRSSWRKDYTNSAECVSQKLYKGDRRLKQTPAEKTKYLKFLEHVADFESMMTLHSSAICLAADKLEADDLIAGWVDMHPDDKITIISADKDFVQLLDHDNITLIDPLSDKPRDLNGETLEYHLFKKCIRANEDNIQSAYPGVRETRLKKAFVDPYEMTSLMEHRWTGSDGTEFRVGDLYNENRHLMDLRAQPKNIQKLIIRTILESKNKSGKFEMFYFLKFCGQYKLEKIAEQLDSFVAVLSK